MPFVGTIYTHLQLILRYKRLMGNNCLLIVGVLNHLSEHYNSARDTFYDSLKILQIKANIAGITQFRDQHFIKFVHDIFTQLFNAGRIELTQVHGEATYHLKPPTIEEFEPISTQFSKKSGTVIHMR